MLLYKDTGTNLLVEHANVASSLDMISQDPSSALISPSFIKQSLLLYRKQLALFLEAITFFHQKKLIQFDAQVGDTLCQIRAYKICLLSDSLKKIDYQRMKNKIVKAMTSISQLINQSLYNECFPSTRFCQNQTVKSFFEKYNLEFNFSYDYLFIFLSYFLSKFSVKNESMIPISVCESQVKFYLNCSRNSAKRMIHKFQKHLSILSCSFIKDLAEQLREELPDYRIIFESLINISDENRMVLPCFDVTRLILSHCLAYKKPIAILIKELNAKHNHVKNFYPKEFDFFETGAKVLTNTNAVMVFSSVTMLKNTHDDIFKQLSLVGIKQLLLANASLHPQFSGIKLAAYKSNPYAHLLSEKRYKVAALSAIEGLENEVSKLEMEIQALNALLKYFVYYIEMGHSYGCYRDNLNYLHVPHIFCLSDQEILNLS